MAVPKSPLTRWSVIAAVVALSAAMIVVVILGGMVSKKMPLELRAVANAVFCLTGGVIVLWLVAQRWLGVDAAAVGVQWNRSATRAFAAASLVGVLGAVSALALATSAGGYRVISWASTGVSPVLMLSSIVATLLHAAFEELWFRAGLAGLLKERFPTVLAVLAPGVCFGGAHALNDGATVLGIINIVLVGSAIGLAYVAPPYGRSPSLAWPIGLHFGWNQALYSAGVAVSGDNGHVALVTLEPQASVWSGYAFGVEASPATTVVVTLLVALFTLAAKASADQRRGHASHAT